MFDVLLYYILIIINMFFLYVHNMWLCQLVQTENNNTIKIYNQMKKISYINILKIGQFSFFLQFTIKQNIKIILNHTNFVKINFLL